MSNNTVQSLWIGDRLTLMEQLSIKSFIANGHEYHLYVYDDVKDIPSRAIVKDANEIIPESEVYKSKFLTDHGEYCGFSDYFRIKLIIDKGGYWADNDFVCLKHFDFKEEYVFSSEMRAKGLERMNTGIIKCPQDDYYLQQIYKHMTKDAVRKTQGGLIFGDNMIKHIKKYDLDKYIKKYDVFCKIKFAESCNLIVKGLMKNYDYYNDCYAVHLWRQIMASQKEVLSSEKNSFKRKLKSMFVIDRDKIYSTDTVYGFWQDKYL